MTTRLEHAQQIAAEAHEGQLRRDGTPYITHPRRVAIALQTAEAGEDQVLMGLLHDALEDGPAKMRLDFEKRIAETCGNRVLRGVLLLTRESDMSYEVYLDRVFSARATAIVKYFDVVDNLMDDPTPKQKIKYKEFLHRFGAEFLRQTG